MSTKNNWATDGSAAMIRFAYVNDFKHSRWAHCYHCFRKDFVGGNVSIVMFTVQIHVFFEDDMILGLRYKKRLH